MRRLAHVLRRIVEALALCLVFVAGLVIGVMTEAGTPTFRRAVVQRVDVALASMFKGRVVIERVASVGPFGVNGLDVNVSGPAGRRVLALSDVHVGFAPVSLIESLIGGKGPIRVHIPALRIENADVHLVQLRDGSLTIARAFQPAKPSTSSGRGRTVDVDIDRIDVLHAWIHGHTQPLPVVDAELRSARAAFHMNARTTTLAVQRARLLARSMPHGANPDGNLSASLALSRRASTAVRATFRGTLAGVKLAARAKMRGRFVEADVSLPPVAPSALATLGFSVPWHAPVDATLHAAGTLPVVATTATITSEGARVVLTGWASLQPYVHARAWLVASGVRLGNVSPKLRSGPVALSGHAVVALPPSGAELHASVQTRPAQVAGHAVPALRAVANLRGNALDGRLYANEPGAPTSIDFALRPGGAGSPVLEFDGEVSARDLARAPLVPPSVSGAARVSVRGRLALATKRLSARLRAEGNHLHLPGAAMGHVILQGTARGSLSDPVLSLRASGSQLTAGGNTFPRYRATIQGTPGDLAIHANLGTSAGPNITLATRLQSGGARGTRLSGVDTTWARGPVRAHVNAKLIAIHGGRIVVKDLRVRGVGSLDASIRVGSSRLQVEAIADSLDLGEIARLAGKPELVHGVLDADISLDATRVAGRGRVRASVVDFSHGKLDHGRAQVDLALDDHSLVGTARVQLERVASLDLDAIDVKLPSLASVLHPARLRHVSGRVVAIGNVQLGRLRDLPHPAALDKLALDGLLRFRLAASRDTPDGMPQLDLTASTQRFRAKPRTPGETVKHVPDGVLAELTGLDARARMQLDGASGRTAVDLAVLHRQLVLAELHVATRIPYARLVAHPSGLKRIAMQTPLTLHAFMPVRPLRDLPEAIVSSGARGRAGFDVQASGSIDDPRVKLGVSLDHVGAAGGPTVSGRVDGRYDGHNAHVAIELGRAGRRVLDARADLELDVKRLLAGSPRPAVTARARLDKFGLDVFSRLRDSGIHGSVSGALAVDVGHGRPRADADVVVDRLQIDQALFKSASLHVHANKTRLQAQVEALESHGFAKAAVEAGLDWKAPLDVSVDPRRRFQARLSAKSFQAAALLPFVRGGLAELRGDIDADLQADLRPGRSSVTGTARVRKAVFQVPAIGQEFRNVQAQLTARRGGVVELTHASLQGTTGRVRLQGRAKLDGFRLADARAKLTIDKGEKLPVTLQGVGLGEAWGNVEARAVMHPADNHLDVLVSIPKLHFEAPSIPDIHVQSLADAPHIAIGVHRPGGFVTLPLQPISKPSPPTKNPLTIGIVVDVGKDVWIREGRQVQVKLVGQLRVEMANASHVSGRIRLDQGRLDVKGKVFRIEDGLVTIQPQDPSNPIVVASAVWTSPDNTRVIATFTGPIKSGKLTLRSDPALSQDEILSLLLFGSPDGSFGVGTGSSSGLATAVGVGGGAATQGLNAALSDLTSIDISTRIDTSKGTPRPEVVVQLTPRVSASAAYSLEQPAPGQPPDRTFLIVDFRVLTRWSIATTFGDRGASQLDVVWSYRY